MTTGHIQPSDRLEAVTVQQVYRNLHLIPETDQSKEKRLADMKAIYRTLKDALQISRSRDEDFIKFVQEPGTGCV